MRIKTVKFERLDTLTGFRNIKIGAEMELGKGDSEWVAIEQLAKFVDDNIKKIRKKDLGEE